MYDIFKKLTRGAIFNKSRNNNNNSRQKDEDVKKDVKTNLVLDDIKEEINGADNDDIKKEDDVDTFRTFSNSTAENKKGKKRKKSLTVDEANKKQKMLEEEKVNQFRNENNISVVGRHVAKPLQIFDDAVINTDIIKNLAKMGYQQPTPIQKQAIPVMLDNRQILACAPTGSGKTAAFIVPIIQNLGTGQNKGFRALIICPTRELAKQTQKEFILLSDTRNLKVHVINKVKEAVEKYGPKSSKKFDVLITTPNRLCYLLKQEKSISLSNIQWLIIDEADKLFEEGKQGFRDQLNDIITACTSSNLKIAMFSATQTPVVAKWAVHNMKGLIRVTIGHKNTTTDLIDQELLYVGNESGKLLAIRELIQEGIKPPVLIFVQSKERAQQLFTELIYDGINVDAIHADRTQKQRDNTVRSFREGGIWVLICTELMARGVDFKGVNLVINYDFPSTAISYIHRVGRAGRAGRRGKAITFFTTDDIDNLRSIAHVLQQSGCEVPEYMLKIKKKRKGKKFKQPSVVQRDEIITKPLYERKKHLFKMRKGKKSNKNATKEDTTESD